MELHHSLMAGRILDTREEIINRIEVLKGIPGLHAAERQAMEDALSGLRTLEKEELKYAEQQRRVAQRAMERLNSVGPTVQWMKSGTANEERD